MLKRLQITMDANVMQGNKRSQMAVYILIVPMHYHHFCDYLSMRRAKI